MFVVVHSGWLRLAVAILVQPVWALLNLEAFVKGESVVQGVLPVLEVPVALGKLSMTL